jgi:membrane fusion protein
MDREAFATASLNEPPAFLDREPPPWAARSLATILLLLFVVAVVVTAVVRVPETVSATFVLGPVRGADPIRTLHDGIVDKVNVEDAQTVEKAAVLFVIASEPVGDRMAERQTLDARLGGGSGRLTNERQKFDNQRRADSQERERLEQRLANLEKQVTVKEQQAALSQDIAARQRRSFDEGVGTWMDASRQKLEADRLALELEQVRSETTDTRNALARLTFEMASRRAAFAELERGIGEEMAAYRVRKSVLDQESAREGNAMSVEAPCAGTIVKLHVRSHGAVVHEGDVLAEVVCAGERLQAELRLPEQGMALVRSGQPVKLLYDSFPYQRYGVQYGTLRWLSPASTAEPGGAAFRALAALESDTVGVQGVRRPVLPGMTGRANVIVGRRSLASYALEPLRQIRESLATGPQP